MVIIKNNRRGMTLIEIMVAMGLVSIIGVTVMRLTDNITKEQKRMQYTFELQTITNQVTYLLAHKNACTNTLKNKVLNSYHGISGSDATANILKDKNDSLYDLHLPPEVVSARLYLPLLPPPDNNLKDTTKVIKPFISFSLKNNTTIKREFALSVKFGSTANTITECFAADEGIIENAKSELCQQLFGGTYDDGRCDSSVLERACEGTTGYQWRTSGTPQCYSPALAQGTHNQAQCSTAGGSVSDNYCQFSRSACPGGWTCYRKQYKEETCDSGDITCGWDIRVCTVNAAWKGCSSTGGSCTYYGGSAFLCFDDEHTCTATNITNVKCY